jgi:acetylornithine deacetylase/succinyl-diaminopimelate desuccinylase-like protein
VDDPRASSFIDDIWQESIVPTLVDYIRIPNKSPSFDRDWERHGYMEDAVQLVAGWCRDHAPRGAQFEVVRLPGRTPLLFMEVPGTLDDTVLLYGHLDKQPEMSGWEEGLGPWTPVIRGDKLFGRGGADDGYSAFASIAAILALQQQGLPHARCVILIEACEESGSFDLPHYIEHLRGRIGTPSLVVCLDSGAGNYEQLWLTVSLRGMISGRLRVEILEEGIHSGVASGVVPSSFRILRQLLSRIEDQDSGRLLLPELHAEVPYDRLTEAERLVQTLGAEVWRHLPLVPGARPMGDSDLERVLGRTWRATLSVTGAEGLPPLESAGNVLRPATTLTLSIRLPPTADPQQAAAAVKRRLETDPPYGARVYFDGASAPGWNAPSLAPWLSRSLEQASQTCFGRPFVCTGEGGGIPFMAMLGEAFPEAQFVVTGVLGPGSNAHGPNEFLHIPYARRLTHCVARVITDHARRNGAHTHAMPV